MSAPISRLLGLEEAIQAIGLALLLGVFSFVHAQGSGASSDAAGRFISVTGEVTIVARDGSRRTAERDAALQEGESIVTGPNALAQLRLRDSSLFSVRADTEVRLDEFRFTGRDDRNSSFAMSIVKGGFRTITGFISQLNRSGYRIATPTTTIGVRGTHFEAVHLPAAVQQVPAGTYNRVFDGITQMQNAAGVGIQVSRNQTGFAGVGNVPPVLVTPPPAIFGRPTPVPRAAVRPEEPAAETAKPAAPGREGAPALRDALPGGREILRPDATARERAIAPTESAPTRLLAPTLESGATRLPGTTTLNPDAILQTPTTTLERSTTLTPIAPSIQTAPTLSPIAPSTTTILQPQTTIIQSPTTLQQPTTTIQPKTTTTPTTTTSPTRTISPTITR